VARPLWVSGHPKCLGWDVWTPKILTCNLSSSSVNLFSTAVTTHQRGLFFYPRNWRPASTRTHWGSSHAPLPQTHRCKPECSLGWTFSWKSSRAFIVIVLNTKAKTAQLTTPTLQLSPAQQKLPRKFYFLLRLGVHLQLTPINYAPKIFLRPGGARAPSAPPGYANAQNV